MLSQFSPVVARLKPLQPMSHYHTPSLSAHTLVSILPFSFKDVPLVVKIGASSVNLLQAHISLKLSLKETMILADSSLESHDTQKLDRSQYCIKSNHVRDWMPQRLVSQQSYVTIYSHLHLHVGLRVESRHFLFMPIDFYHFRFLCGVLCVTFVYTQALYCINYKSKLTTYIHVFSSVTELSYHVHFEQCETMWCD